jgi:Pyruvate/2-oxoacid:ferredoxin oxidoreductase delta subunit
MKRSQVIEITKSSKKISDFSGVPQAYLEIAQNYSSAALIGPPLCDELVALIQHMFTEEEAFIIRHLKPFRMKTAESLAKAEHRPVEEVLPIIERLAQEKSVIASFGSFGKRRYFIMPLVPGTFEWVLIHPSLNDISPWHRRFAELFDALYDTGYEYDYYSKFGEMNGFSPIRYIPIQQSIQSHPMALPTDKLEEILDRYNDFAVGICQCRTTKIILKEDCGRPLEVCSAFGPFVEALVQKGKMRRIEKKELIEIKANAEASGLITWMLNVDEKTAKIGNCSCSCCGCCCPMLRTITEFDISGLVAPPHFRPVFDLKKCTFCGKCAAKCQMSAITVDAKTKNIIHQIKRCIGCGQCTLACDKQRAISMEPVSNYSRPPRSFFSMGVKALPVFSRMILDVRRKRKK